MLKNKLKIEVGKPLVEAKGEIGGAADIFEWKPFLLDYKQSQIQQTLRKI